jgi:hypothetical protein
VGKIDVGKPDSNWRSAAADDVLARLCEIAA